MIDVEQTTETELTDVLAYAGLVLVAFELVKSLVIRPIKNFYTGITFAHGMSFVSYEQDVLVRHNNEFEACLLYLRDFMYAIDSDDLHAIQGLRKHRNDIAHDLPNRLESLKVEDYAQLLKALDKALFKLSNHNAYIEIGSDPKIQAMNIEWDTVQGHEYILFRALLDKVHRLKGRLE
ncbi:hypothetical protein [Xanthomonas campestris]|uniref:hypothetical protein n=1 Tax=Xanthomonas campestris TaxID=339 RepID=UPI00096EE296|nr:hypothetical protein [Xanthomonas campestris]MCF8824634.1 hypothetical protein [Xanthomonas campestris pv. raphani]MEA9840077.1 hypothetical protein [Xanthomonas campestris pv. raphani]MEA9877660.1 hypothetical protein [Xanthomonas campestris pv. raphani]MEA9892171.1 hypothetical protein [Xanthomonas campestris pv. raphani]MEA9932925.1 hypothetical protein [Xanthomonas campestris pv. raphani]